MEILRRRRRCASEKIVRFCLEGAAALACGFFVLFLLLSAHPWWQNLLIWSQSSNNFFQSQKFMPFDNHEAKFTSLNHIIFGIASSAEAWKGRKVYVDLWWRPGKTRGYVWLDRPTLEPWPASSPPFKISAETSRFNFTHRNGYRSAIRISRIVLETFRLGLPGVRWFVMGDDDTVFFTENLVKVLAKYDHKQYWYIGSNSESVEQNRVHGYSMAFGGGGFAISFPLAKALAEIQDECLERYTDLYGSDQRVHACLTELGVPLTMEPGFHQVDIHGSLFGILTAHPLTPLVSLHHLEAVDAIFPGMTRAGALRHLMEAVNLDSDRVAQQSICYDRGRNWTASVSWGFCVQIFKSVRLPRVMDHPLKTFSTWGRTSGPFMFNTRAVGREPCDNPTVFYMENVRNSGSGQISGRYVRQPEKERKKCSKNRSNTSEEVRSVRVVSNKMSADWTLAPRRQCCDIVSFKNGAVEIKIRSCRERESSLRHDI